MKSHINTYDLTTEIARRKLKPRSRPYFKLLGYGRHVGYLRRVNVSFWVARFRTLEGNYCQYRLGVADDRSANANKEVTPYAEAEKAAREWFTGTKHKSIAAQERPFGVSRHLKICPIGEHPTVGHALNDYVEWKRLSAAKSHFETNLSLINLHLVPTLANKLVSEIDGSVIRDFIKSVLETAPKRGNKNYVAAKLNIHEMSDEQLRKRKGTINTVLGILRIALQMAWESGKTDDDRSWRCIRYLPTYERPRTLFLNRAECRELLSHCREDLRDLVLAALYTGCRVAEILRLTARDVGREGYGIYVAPSKNYRSRFVFLPDEAMIWFLTKTEGRAPDDRLFLREDGWSWPHNSYRHSFASAKLAAGISDEFTFHGLRHTYASQLVQRGVSIITVAEQLGHKDPTTVLRTYGHLSPENRSSQIRHNFAPLDVENQILADERSDTLKAYYENMYGKPNERKCDELSKLANIRTLQVLT